MDVWHSTRTWAEMVKLSHSVFALPFAVVAAVLAGRHRASGWPAAGQLGLIVVCMVAARSFAMTFNRIVDAAIDARNPRTATRPLPEGRISLREARLFLGVSALVFLAGCEGFRRLYANPWPLVLAVPTLIVLAAYSYTKRFTSLSHFWLGAAIGLAPLAAWLAIDPASLGWPAVLLSAAVLFWIGGFDIIYACQDLDVDRRDGLYSLPAAMGVRGALWVSRSAHVLTIFLLAAFGWHAGLRWVYGTTLALTALLLAAEQAVVRPADLSRVNLAFFTINGFVSVLLGLGTIADVLTAPAAGS